MGSPINAGSISARTQSSHGSSRNKLPLRRNTPTAALHEDLRRWIDLVIVPILVSRFLREKDLREEETDG